MDSTLPMYSDLYLRRGIVVDRYMHRPKMWVWRARVRNRPPSKSVGFSFLDFIVFFVVFFLSFVIMNVNMQKYWYNETECSNCICWQNLWSCNREWQINEKEWRRRRNPNEDIKSILYVCFLSHGQAARAYATDGRSILNHSARVVVVQFFFAFLYPSPIPHSKWRLQLRTPSEQQSKMFVVMRRAVCYSYCLMDWEEKQQGSAHQ